MTLTANEARLRVYDMYAAEHDDLPAEHPGLPITDEMVARYTLALNTGRSKRGGTGYGRAQVRDWLERPEKWSPYIDEEAVRRAVNFDWSIMDKLTDAEMTEVTTRLAAMDDPFSEAKDEVLDRAVAQARGVSYGRWNRTADERRRRFLAGPRRLQQRMWTALDRLKGATAVTA